MMITRIAYICDLINLSSHKKVSVDFANKICKLVYALFCKKNNINNYNAFKKTFQLGFSKFILEYKIDKILPNLFKKLSELYFKYTVLQVSIYMSEIFN